MANFNKTPCLFPLLPRSGSITDNSLKDVQTEEDGQFIASIDTMVGTTTGVGTSGVQQNFNISGGITRDTYKEVLSKLEDLNLNNGIILMNRRTAKEFLGWNRSEIGGDLAQDLLKQDVTNAHLQSRYDALPTGRLLYFQN